MHAAPCENINVCGRRRATEVTAEASKSNCACGERGSGGDSGRLESTRGSDWKHRGSKTQLKTSQRAIYLSLDPGKHKKEDERKVFWCKLIVEREENGFQNKTKRMKEFVYGRNGRGRRRGSGREDKAREHNRSKVNTDCTHTSPSSQSLFLPVGGVCVCV